MLVLHVNFFSQFTIKMNHFIYCADPKFFFVFYIDFSVLREPDIQRGTMTNKSKHVGLRNVRNKELISWIVL